MESIAVWQGATLCGIVAWIVMASHLNVTRKLRSFFQPWVAHHVINGVPLILQIQKYEHSRHTFVKWAQRSDILFITIELPDAQDVKLKLELEGKFFFSATSGAEKIPYEVDINLCDKVDVNESKASIGLRNICYLVKKAENKWWGRLLKQEGKPPGINGLMKMRSRIRNLKMIWTLATSIFQK